ncbi:MAG: hypothetical protein QXX17_03240 [Conexivisphaerales archaeon]
MIVYLSCANGNNFFITAVMEAIKNVNRRHQFKDVELVYPPRKLVGDLGKVLLNVLRIQQAVVALFEVTPRYSADHSLAFPSPGVMIELGKFFGSREFIPVMGRTPSPAKSQDVLR